MANKILRDLIRLKSAQIGTGEINTMNRVNSFQDWGYRFIRGACAISGAITLTGCFAIAFTGNPSLAQVTPDDSLGTQVGINGNTFDITGGTTVGNTNLFHSFGSFSVPDGGVANFQNADTITNIFGRVTGGSPSNILGTIRAVGNANLFLINPSGIIFGQNARLEIGGSFVGTTANGVKFGDVIFPATATPVDPNNSSVLAVNPSALFFNQTPAGVGVSVNQSTLQVPNDQNLFLVGGNVTLNGGRLLAAGGRVELGGLAGSGDVNIEYASTTDSNPSSNFPNVTLRFPDAVPQANISLTNATIDVGSDAGTELPGNIAITGNQLSIVGSALTSRSANSSSEFGVIRLKATAGSVGIDSSVLSTTNVNTASGLAGDIFIDAADGVSINGSRIFSDGRAGRIFIDARNQISIANNSSLSTRSNDDNTSALFSVIKLTAPEGSIFVDQSQLTTTNFGAGYAGDIGISARDKVSLTNSTISSDGNFGRVVIGEFSVPDSNPDIEVSFSPQRVAIANSTLTTNNEASQAGANQSIPSGVISVDANNSISISNNSELQTFTNRTGNAGNVSLQTDGGTISVDNSRVFSTVEPGGRGTGGIIAIETGTLSVSNRSELQTLVRGGGQGDAGLISIEADGEVSLTNRGRIFSTVESGAIGDAGLILMKVGSLVIKSSSDPDNASGLTTSMFGIGNPGYISVQAREDVSVRGNESGIYSASGSESINLGDRTGAVFIDARSLFLRDGARVSVNNLGLGLAGDIVITMREDIILRDRGEISAIAASGQGGNILLTSGDFLVLVSGSQVNTEAFNPNNPNANGGNIFVATKYIIAAPFNTNDVIANAVKGSGGNIFIFANRLYDIKERPEVFPTNDISVSSDYGLDGIITSTVLNADPTQGLSNLPANPIDPSTLIAETCAPRGSIADRQKNQFINSGPGGLPPDPNAAFPGEAGVNELEPANQTEENSTDSPNSTNPENPVPAVTTSPQEPEIVEAQGWVYGKNGDVIFTAQAPTVTPNHPTLTPASTCNGF
jgi:filamentous hemagglutinin family protein